MAENKVFMYSLSTCVWCKRMKTLLETLGVKYDYVFMDQLSGETKEARLNELKKVNPACSFPTVIVNGECVIGFQEDRIRRLLGK